MDSATAERLKFGGHELLAEDVSCSSFPSGEEINRKDEKYEKACGDSPSWLVFHEPGGKSRHVQGLGVKRIGLISLIRWIRQIMICSHRWRRMASRIPGTRT